MHGVDYTGVQSAPSLMSGAFLLPGTLIVGEVRPNYVTVEGSDGSTATASSPAHATGLGQVGEYVRYSYVLDSSTLQDLADTRLQQNIQTVAASVEVATDAHWRPWIDYYVGDIIWVDLAAAGLPADWYRVERISMRFTDESEGARYVVDVGRAVVAEDAAVADKLAAILESGLIDLETGLVTTAATGQASTTVVITVDEVPAHDHPWGNITGAPTPGGDISGNDLSTVKVERIQGREFGATPAPDDGGTILWNDDDLIAVWSNPPVQHAYTITGQLEVGTGTYRLPMTRDLDIVNVRVMIDTAPTGQDAIFDVNLNGTTIYTTQANRPTITAGTNDSGAGTLPDVIAVTAGDYLTVDVDQIGTTFAGEDAIVLIEFGRNLA